LSASLRIPGEGKSADLFRTTLAGLPNQLAQTLANSQPSVLTEHELAKKVLAKTGLRLKPRRSKEETLARYKDSAAAAAASSSSGSFSASSALAAALASTKPLAGGRDASLGAHVPVLPHIMPSGKLGEWDKYKLKIIFQASDVDGSGELSRDEIKGCLSACADYGFCVMTGDEDGHNGSGGGGIAGLGGSSSALLGTSNAAAAAAAGFHAKLTAMLDAVFDAIDVDKSGTVTWKEFLDVVETGVVPPKPPQEAAAAAPAPEPALRSGSRSPRPGAGTKTPGKVPSLALGGGTTTTATAAKSGMASPTRANKSAGVTAGMIGGLTSSSAQLAAAAAILSSATAKKPKKPEPVRVPQLRFRALTAAEARTRGERYFAQAAEAWRRYQAVPTDVHDRDKQLAALRAEMLSCAERGNRLSFIAQALGGELDPPERPPPSPRPRHDMVSFTSLVPAEEEAKRRARGGYTYRVPYPGDEVDADERRTMHLLHPDAIAVAEEEEDADKRLAREAAAARVRRTLGKEDWERYRLAVKARAPHVIHKVDTYI
jgi:hypothetical protein